MLGISKLIKLVIALPILIIGILFIGKLSCSPDYFLPEITGINKIDVEKIDNDTIKLNIVVSVENKNGFKIDLNKFNLKIYNGKHYLGTALSNENYILTKDSVYLMPLKLNIETKRLAKLLSKNSDSLILSLKGKISAKASFINMPIDVDLPFEIDLNKIINENIFNKFEDEGLISIIRTELKDITLTSSKVLITFAIKNPYNLDLILLKYPAKININGKFAGTGDIVTPLNISSKDSLVEGKMLFELSNFDSATSLVNSLLSKKLEYETRGDLYFESFGYSFRMPFSFSGNILEK